MASKLARITSINEDKKILAIVGAGHEEDLINLIKKRSLMLLDIVIHIPMDKTQIFIYSLY